MASAGTGRDASTGREGGGDWYGRMAVKSLGGGSDLYGRLAVVYPQTMEELHLHAIAVDREACEATARWAATQCVPAHLYGRVAVICMDSLSSFVWDGRSDLCVTYLLANGWTMLAATDTVGGLRLPRGSVARVETAPAVSPSSPFLQPSAQLRLRPPQEREKLKELLDYVRSQGPALGSSGVAVFVHPHHAPAPPLAPAERHWLDVYLHHDEKWLVGPRGQPNVAFSSLIRDVWADSIALARLKALQATAAAPAQETVACAPFQPQPTAAKGPMPAASASEPYQPSYRALPPSGVGSPGSGEAEAAADGWLEGGLNVAGAAYEMMPSVQTVASIVSIASTLGSTATGAAEVTAGAVVGAAGSVATAALGAPGSVATAVAGAAVTAAATASKVSLGAVNTAANIVVVGSKVAELVPAPSSLIPAATEADAESAAASDHGVDHGMGLPPALLPPVPAHPGSPDKPWGKDVTTTPVRLSPPPAVQPTAAVADTTTSRLPDVAGAIQDVRDMLPEMPQVLGGRPASAYDEI